MGPSHNIAPPVALCLSVQIVDSPVKPIFFSVYEGFSTVPDQSNEFLLLLLPSRHFLTMVKCGRTEGEEKIQNKIDTEI